MVPLSFGCGSAVFAATATLAPSRAARNAIASPMPRLPPDTNSVLPLSDVIIASVALLPKAIWFIALPLPRHGYADRGRRAIHLASPRSNWPRSGRAVRSLEGPARAVRPPWRRQTRARPALRPAATGDAAAAPPPPARH